MKETSIWLIETLSSAAAALGLLHDVVRNTKSEVGHSDLLWDERKSPAFMTFKPNAAMAG
jgi:hypothetical protein